MTRPIDPRAGDLPARAPTREDPMTGTFTSEQREFAPPSTHGYDALTLAVQFHTDAGTDDRDAVLETAIAFLGFLQVADLPDAGEAKTSSCTCATCDV